MRTQLGLTQSRDSLLCGVHARVVGASDVVAVTVRDTSAVRAAQLANAFAGALVSQRTASFQSQLATAIRRTQEQVLALPPNRRTIGCRRGARAAADVAPVAPGPARPDASSRRPGRGADGGRLAAAAVPVIGSRRGSRAPHRPAGLCSGSCSCAPAGEAAPVAAAARRAPRGAGRPVPVSGRASARRSSSSGPPRSQRARSGRARRRCWSAGRPSSRSGRGARAARGGARDADRARARETRSGAGRTRDSARAERRSGRRRSGTPARSGTRSGGTQGGSGTEAAERRRAKREAREAEAREAEQREAEEREAALPAPPEARAGPRVRRPPGRLALREPTRR